MDGEASFQNLSSLSHLAFFFLHDKNNLFGFFVFSSFIWHFVQIDVIECQRLGVIKVPSLAGTSCLDGITTMNPSLRCIEFEKSNS